jgi:post-segregation antitoxin (ccd killing protein)
MEISVKVPDELAAQARARGLRVEEYVQELLAQQIQENSRDLVIPKTEAEVRAWLASMTQFSDKIPPLPETISRDWIYQEHD